MELIAYDSNLWRVERLQKVARIARTILGLSESQFDALIKAMKDDRGNLVIDWKQRHTQQQELAFSTAWNECGEKLVTHNCWVE